MARSVLCALTFALAAAHLGTAADERRITNASSVRLRSAPATDASIAGELPLGTELVTLAQSGGAEPWYLVRTDAHLDAARYFEPAGHWMVDPAYVQHVHEQNLGTATADEIAWFYVTNGLYGECEGDVPCYVSWQNRLNGWYLQSHPRGHHTDESNADITLTLNDAMDNLRQFPAVLAEFDPKTRCDELHASLDPLMAAITGSTSARKSEALAATDRFAQLCR